MGQYDDIIHLPHHQSPKRAQMSRLDRAAQFAPFAALSGYGAAIAEAGRLTDGETELMEERTDAVNQGLQTLRQHQHQHPEVTVTYFEPDKRKAGGAYRTVTGRVRKLLAYERLLLLQDGTAVSFDRIYDLQVTP